MSRPKCLVLLLALCSFPTYATDTLPSVESVKQLLVVTQTRQLVDDMRNQIDDSMRAALQQSLKGRKLTPVAQKILDRVPEKAMVIFNADVTWESLEPMYVDIYRNSFSQEEVDGMIAFYGTPVGQAVVRKLPVVLQNTVTATQQRMGPLLVKMQKLVEETAAEIEAARNKSGQEPAGYSKPGS